MQAMIFNINTSIEELMSRCINPDLIQDFQYPQLALSNTFFFDYACLSWHNDLRVAFRSEYILINRSDEKENVDCFTCDSLQEWQKFLKEGLPKSILKDNRS